MVEIGTNTDNIIFCACGCRQSFYKYDKKGRQRRYIHGHTAIGRKHTIEELTKMSIAMKGKKRKPLSEATKRKIGESIRLEKHWNWKGDNVGYIALHLRMRKLLPKPDRCIICNIAVPTQLSNISGKYLTVISDWQWLCQSCHTRFDGRGKDFYLHGFKKGHIPWNKGMRMSKEHNMKIREGLKNKGYGKDIGSYRSSQ